MAKEAAEITVAANGSINVAPFGTALPTQIEGALNSAFAELGYVNDDGVTLKAAPNVSGIKSWQSATDTRRLVEARELTAETKFQQWNSDTFVTAFGGGEWTEPSPGTLRFDPPGDTDALAEVSLVIDAHDGDRHHRWVIKRVTVNDEVETNLVRTAEGLLPAVFSALTPDGEDRAWYFLSNDDAAFAASS